MHTRSELLMEDDQWPHSFGTRLTASHLYGRAETRGYKAHSASPKVKSNHKIQELHAWQEPNGNTADSGSDRGEAQKHTHVWLERSVSEQFMRSRGPRGHKWAIGKLAKWLTDASP
jgi:hypothetical protein